LRWAGTASTIHSFLALQLRFVRSDERANIGRHVQQSQPLFLVQGHGKTSHPVDRDCSLFTDLHTDTGRGALLQGLVLFAQTLELIFGFFFGHALASLPGRASLYRCLLVIYSTDVPLPPPVSGALFPVSLGKSDAPCRQSRENRPGSW